MNTIYNFVHRCISVVMATLVLLPAMANAASVTIDFSIFPSGDTGSTVLVTPEATFTSLDSNFYSGVAAIGNEICATTPGAASCEADFEVVFSATIENFTFITLGAGVGDFLEVFAYDASDILMGSVTHTVDGLVDMTAFSGIKRLYFDDSSTADGFAYDQFNFDFVTPVPLPGALWLFGTSLVGLVLGRR